MNNIIANFNQILDFAKTYNLPLTKKRGILREYLQCKILDILYRQDQSSQIILVGGTGLRLTRGIDRFSEDLDFDLAGKAVFSKTDGLMRTIIQNLKKENLSIDFYHNKTSKRNYYELRFKDLLAELSISQQKQEKLVIKFDFEKFWQKHTREIFLLNRYGFLANLITVSPDQLLVQKLTAYLKRKQTQARDIYDVVWLISHQAKIDLVFLKNNMAPEGLIQKALKKFQQEKSKLKTFEKRLKPFLINEDYIDKLDLFPQLVNSLQKSQKH